ncbi:MAG: insulinase family protein [Bacteroidaceae bacterium]|nr:insulinase family protein [Bacteroidaceae bacterium]
MKKISIICCLLLLAAASAFAQQMPPVPLDQNVKKGTLPNGLTYYLRHNEWPEKRANFYIAQKVGSMQEEDNQRGLAHFLEHMCFNGTTNFPGDRLKTYLESIGVKFGENLNAYTSFDETVYNIDNVNVETAGALDSCLLILHDWSHDLLLEDKEIDKERGVINEEWRMRSSAMMRMYEQGLPTIYEGSKYGTRLPIGTMDIVMNFPYNDIRDYYKKWYRPDLQAIIIVGDIDVNDMEQKIQRVFADIQPAAADAAVREYYPVPDNSEPIVSVLKDKEQDNTLIYLMWKDEAYPRDEKGNLQYIAIQYMITAMESMFNDRINEIMQKENAPFIGAQFQYGDFLVSSTKSAFNGIAVSKDNGYKDAIMGLYREILRMKKHGFTASEYERFKAEYLSQLESAYNHRDKVESVSFVQEYVQHFLENEPSPGIEWEYATMNQLVPAIPLEAVNKICEQIPDSNLVVTMFCPDKEGIIYPSKEDILAIMKEVEGETIEAYVEEVNTDPLVDNIPATGNVVSITDDAYDAKLITLSNGIKVHVKHTDFSPNKISMSATSWGGTSLYPDSEYDQTSNIDLVTIGGWGNFSATELQKKLAGIQASASPSVSSYNEGISASCVKKDFETMLQLTYLCFTAPRKDQEAFNSLIQRQKAALANAELDPSTSLQDTIAKVIYNNNVRAVRTKADDLDRINYDRIIELYKERFADANDFEFFIVGDCNADSIAPLLAKYLGALPVLDSSENYNSISMDIVKGERKNIFEKELQTPNAVVLFLYHTPLEITQKNQFILDFIETDLDMTYTESVREDEGGAYGVPVQTSLDIFKNHGKCIIQLPTAPEKRERMTEIVYKGIENLVKNGPNEDHINKCKEYLLRRHAEKLKTNSYWMGQMTQKARWNRDWCTDFEAVLNSITPADIQAVAKQLFRNGNHIEVGMTSPLEK